jgi:hypothetical protein
LQACCTVALRWLAVWMVLSAFCLMLDAICSMEEDASSARDRINMSILRQ